MGNILNRLVNPDKLEEYESPSLYGDGVISYDIDMDHEFGFRELTRADKIANNLKFTREFQNAISGLSRSKGVNAVVDDYVRVQELLVDPNGFGDLAKWCEPVIDRWTYDFSVGGVDREDQHQEGLLTLWAADPKYQGRNFARFHTMLRASLRFKLLNMLRYSYADKRRINRDTLAMGSATNPGDSYYASLLDQFSRDAWKLEQTEQNLNDNPDPFATTPLVDMMNVSREFKKARVRQVTTRKKSTWRRDEYGGIEEVWGDEIDQDNFPYLDEEKLRIMLELDTDPGHRPMAVKWNGLSVPAKHERVVISRESMYDRWE